MIAPSERRRSEVRAPLVALEEREKIGVDDVVAKWLRLAEIYKANLDHAPEDPTPIIHFPLANIRRVSGFHQLGRFIDGAKDISGDILGITDENAIPFHFIPHKFCKDVSWDTRTLIIKSALHTESPNNQFGSDPDFVFGIYISTDKETGKGFTFLRNGDGKYVAMTLIYKQPSWQRPWAKSLDYVTVYPTSEEELGIIRTALQAECADQECNKACYRIEEIRQLPQGVIEGLIFGGTSVSKA